MKIAVSGASGFLGSRLVPALVAAGHEVFALARSPGSARTAEALGATAIDGDLNAPPLKLPPCDAVIHAAAHFRFTGPREAFRSANVAGTRALLGAAREAGARRFVYVSAAAVVMDDKGSPMVGVDETAPMFPDSFSPYIATKAEAEALVRAANGPDFTTIALRPPGIWGAGDAFSSALPLLVKRRQFGFIGGGRFGCVTCHVDNVVEALICAIDRGRGGAAYFINDPEPTTLRDFLTKVAAALGLKIDRAPSLPYGIAWALGRLMEGWAWATRAKSDPPMSRTMVRLIGRPFTTDDSMARAELGYVGRVSRTEGLKSYDAELTQG